jgi:hypothetical protein
LRVKNVPTVQLAAGPRVLPRAKGQDDEKSGDPTRIALGMNVMARMKKSRRRNSAASSVAKPKREMPKSGARDAPAKLHGNAGHGNAGKGIVHAKDALENAKAAEAAHLSPPTGRAADKGATNYSLKAIEMARSNTNAAFDYAHELMGVKSLSEFVELSTAHACSSFAAVIAQAKEFTELAQKATTEIADSLKTGDAKAMKSKKDRRQDPGENDISGMTPKEEVLLLHALE